MTGSVEIEILDDPATVAKRAAQIVVNHAQAAIGKRGSFTFAVSGGRTPWAMFKELANDDFPWTQTTIFQVDERLVGEGDPDRNLTHLLDSLPPVAHASVRAMPVGEIDTQDAAERYARSLPERFDLIHLGLGPDGHTASLVPGDPVLDIGDRAVALTQPYMGHRRMTLTYPVIDRSCALLWLVTGADKLDALRRLRQCDKSIPAGRVTIDGQAMILADRAAAGD